MLISLTFMVSSPNNKSWSFSLKQWKYLKSGRREIQFQQVIDIAKIFPRCLFWIHILHLIIWHV